ncbi:serine protease inhibitor Kazal-type 6-like isoform X2 [Lagopus muta]|uniref:serine protease inhibitor Kazal-type 6-like isoform X2 n=1 Tax=Lagopus muta TaxID=64668 RepID=UPI00209D9BD8|nr:serine protease inhibitor Kazal-type 6-like isoform X2 [Lagopus muta]
MFEAEERERTLQEKVWDSSGLGKKGRKICKEFLNRSVFCTRESNPHCGTDGMTYGNKCAFCKAVLRSGGKIRLKHMGKC